MDIKDFYSELLEVNHPWQITEVLFDRKRDSVEIRLTHVAEEKAICPLCGADCPVSERASVKRWRHFNTCRTPTYLSAEVPIVRCAEHGKREILPPLAQPDSGFSKSMMQHIVETSKHLAIGELCAVFGIGHQQAAAVLRTLDGVKNDASTGRICITPDISSEAENRQMSLFDIDTALLNEGLNEFRLLNLERGLEVLRKHQALYPAEKDARPYIRLMEYLQTGMLERPSGCPDEVVYFMNLWTSFEHYIDEVRFQGKGLIADVKASFFSKICESIDSCGLSEAPYLTETIPTGYVYIQSGQYDKAIALLQTCLRTNSGDAAVYGYMGDAYYLRGEPKVARKCYQEALLIDPSAVDWRHFRDPEIIDLKNRLLADSDMGDRLVMEWLPSHARIEGLFERRRVTVNNGLKELIEDYLHLKKQTAKKEKPELKARLFFRALILSDNEESLKFIKKVTLYDLRRLMKEINGPLFERYLRNVVEPDSHNN